MARVGELQKLFQTFLRLKKTCKKAEVTFFSDSSGDCHVTLTCRLLTMATRLPGGEVVSQEVRRGVPESDPLPRHLKEFLVPRKLLLPLLLPLPERAGDADLPQSSAMSEDDWEGLTQKF